MVVVVMSDGASAAVVTDGKERVTRGEGGAEKGHIIGCHEVNWPQFRRRG